MAASNYQIMIVAFEDRGPHTGARDVGLPLL